MKLLITILPVLFLTQQSAIAGEIAGEGGKLNCCIAAYERELNATLWKEEKCKGERWTTAVPGACNITNKIKEGFCVTNGRQTIVTVYQYSFKWDKKNGCIVKATGRAKDIQVDTCDGPDCDF